MLNFHSRPRGKHYKDDWVCLPGSDWEWCGPWLGEKSAWKASLVFSYCRVFTKHGNAWCFHGLSAHLCDFVKGNTKNELKIGYIKGKNIIYKKGGGRKFFLYVQKYRPLPIWMVFSHCCFGSANIIIRIQVRIKLHQDPDPDKKEITKRNFQQNF